MKNVNKIFTPLHRGLHWVMAILMTILFITGFLRMYWMGKTAILTAMATNMQGVALTNKQTIGTIKSIINPMWEWHKYAAYILFFVLTARIFYMFIKGIRFPNPFSFQIDIKERLQGTTYIFFYLFVLANTITGIYLKWGNGNLKESMEAIHKWAVYWFPVFIVLHFGGIWLAEKSNKKGIASKMIGGDK